MALIPVNGLRLAVVKGICQIVLYPSNYAWVGFTISNSEGRIHILMVLQAVLLEKLACLVRYNPNSFGVGLNYSR